MKSLFTERPSRRKNLGLIGALALLIPVGLGVAPAQASAVSAVSAAPAEAAANTTCGFYMSGILAQYNHCSTTGENVWVHVTSIIAPGAPPGLGGGSTLLCLSPGDHSLVPYVYGIITGASSNGNTCSNPDG